MNRILGTLAFLAASTMVYANNTSTSPVFELDPATGAIGDMRPETDYSTLKRRERTVEYTIRTSGLFEQTPHTVWLVVFNEPRYCQTTPCGLADFPFVPGHDPRVQASFVNAGGGVSGFDGSGYFTGTVYAIGKGTGINASEVVIGPGLLNPQSAQIDIVLRYHGQPGSFSDLLAAIKEYRGACNENNLIQPPCGDYQGSAHLP